MAGTNLFIRLHFLSATFDTFFDTPKMGKQNIFLSVKKMEATNFFVRDFAALGMKV